MEIKRDDYLDEIKAVMHNGLVKVITGIRRCGKSYFLFTIFQNHLRSIGVNDDQIVSVQLDDDDFEALRSLKMTGDFFRKIVVTGGNERPWADESGILHVGVIPFLLDKSIMES